MTEQVEDKVNQPYNDPYLRDTKAPVQLLGAAMLVNPFPDHTSSQRLMMFTHHLVQAQIISGCEHPRIFTGYEPIIGEYEFNTTVRTQDAQIRDVVPRFIVNSGASPIHENPSWTVIYRGNDDNKIDYFTLDRYTMRTDGFGYFNKWFQNNVSRLNKSSFIPKEMKLSTSPAHDGNKYMLGTNLNAAYMSIPEATEDAFVISESAAKKLETQTFGKVSFKILPNQIPINLYGDDNEYKFIPDVAEQVNENGVLCALRSPTANSIIYDMSPSNLHKVQYLHDAVFYAPPGATIVDVDVVVNRNCKNKTPKEVFSQVEKYRDATNTACLRIWEAYNQAKHEGLQMTPAFNNLVVRSLSSLLLDNVRIPGYHRKARVTAVRRKEPIEFIYITITYAVSHPCSLGAKISGRYGN